MIVRDEVLSVCFYNCCWPTEKRHLVEWNRKVLVLDWVTNFTTSIVALALAVSVQAEVCLSRSPSSCTSRKKISY